MRQDEGWRWLRNSSGIVAAVTGLIALPVVTAVAVFGLVVPFTMDGCEYTLRDLGPRDLGLSVDTAGAITARVPLCYSGGAEAVQLVGPDEAVVWRAEASEPQELRDFVVGVPPERFADATALAGPLDPASTYELQLLQDADPETPAAAAANQSDESIDGAYALFRPADLRPDQMLFREQGIAAEEFDDAACTDVGSS